jgi:hypothetical protein
MNHQNYRSEAGPPLQRCFSNAQKTCYITAVETKAKKRGVVQVYPPSPAEKDKLQDLNRVPDVSFDGRGRARQLTLSLS